MRVLAMPNRALRPAAQALQQGEQRALQAVLGHGAAQQQAEDLPQALSSRAVMAAYQYRSKMAPRAK